jgi:hypothetical protein
MRLLAAVAAVLALSACSSGGTPGAQSVLDQTDKATKTQVDVALQDAARAEAAHQATNGSYTTDLAALGVTPAAGVTLTIPSADATSYCVQATHADLEGTWHISSTSPGVTEGPC